MGLDISAAEMKHRPSLTIKAGSIASVSRTGAYDIHFVVTPDPDRSGNLLVSASIVDPAEGYRTSHSRTLSVRQGEPATFDLTALSKPVDVRVKVAARRVQ